MDLFKTLFIICYLFYLMQCNIFPHPNVIFFDFKLDIVGI